MKKNVLKTMLTAATICTMALTAVGCGSSTTTNSAKDNTTDNTSTTSEADSQTKDKATTNEKSVSGKVTMAGSTSMEKLSNALKEAFMQKYPDITVTAEFTGSSAGLEALAAGTVDIGNSSRELKDTEVQAGAVSNVVAIDGIAVITDKDNGASDITSEDLAKVYTGDITNWKDLGGADEAIVVIGREAGSGTRGAFEELLKIQDACKYANELDSTGAVLAKVASTPGAIGYVSLDVVDDTVKALSLDGVESTEENIVAGKYALSRPFVMATKGEISAQSEAVQTFFDYIQSDEGKEVIKKVGLILPQ